MKLGRLEWLEQRCRWQIVGREATASPRPTRTTGASNGSEKLRGPGLAVLHALWHWRESWAEKINTPPFKVVGNEMLMRLARAADEGAPPERGHAASTSAAATTACSPRWPRRSGAASPPTRNTLPRRERRRDFNPMTPDELARQDRIKADRDRLASGLQLDPTLIATRSQLALLARDPAVHRCERPPPLAGQADQGRAGLAEPEAFLWRVRVPADRGSQRREPSRT